MAEPANPGLRDWLQEMRPAQWTKNLAVSAAFVFALGDRYQQLPLSAALQTAAATALFCLFSSAVYLWNDVCDAANDRRHPVKRNRPIAAGRIPPWQAVTAAGLMVLIGLLCAWMLNPRFALVGTVYIGMHTAYSLFLKRVALLDVFMIALGFVLRALAGAVAIQVVISPWLLLCALMLALFLALCKRRHEKVSMASEGSASRPALEQYDAELLDRYISIVSAATIVCYALYTLWPATVEKFGSDRLGFTIPFVIYGVFRYLQLVYREGHGERPERVLLRDGPMIINLALYALTVGLILLT